MFVGSGNVIVILVLSGASFHETFHKLLISLAITDSVFIVCAVFTVMIRALGLLESGAG